MKNWPKDNFSTNQQPERVPVRAPIVNAGVLAEGSSQLYNIIDHPGDIYSPADSNICVCTMQAPPQLPTHSIIPRIGLK